MRMLFEMKDLKEIEGKIESPGFCDSLFPTPILRVNVDFPKAIWINLIGFETIKNGFIRPVGKPILCIRESGGWSVAIQPPEDRCLIFFHEKLEVWKKSFILKIKS
jgi:hypothetical protein